MTNLSVTGLICMNIWITQLERPMELWQIYIIIIILNLIIALVGIFTKE